MRALREPQKKGLSEDYSFPARQRPYRHQLQAWQTLIEGSPPRSVLVTSGTGSGKTECFLIPILNDLATELEQRQNAPLIGVRALFLYPLNALIKSQKDRLVAWSEPFRGGLHFCPVSYTHLISPNSVARFTGSAAKWIGSHRNRIATG